MASTLLPNARRTLNLVRALVAFVIFGLVVSGLTAFPLLHELNWLAGFLANETGSLSPSAYPEGSLTWWIMRVRLGLEETYAAHAFIAYGTDWLAFGRLVIALFFVPVWISPHQYRGNIDVGIAACVLVIPLALICGPIRGIPFYWQLIDSAFGVGAVIPLLWIRRLIGRLHAAS